MKIIEIIGVFIKPRNTGLSGCEKGKNKKYYVPEHTESSAFYRFFGRFIDILTAADAILVWVYIFVFFRQ